MLDITKIYQTHGIDFRAGGTHKHVRVGWVGVACPFCSGNPGYHLGYCIEGQYAGSMACWRCKGIKVKKALKNILRLPDSDIRRIMAEHRIKDGHVAGPSVEEEVAIRRKGFKYPVKTEPLYPHHAKYLIKRGFDPEQIVNDWGVMSTGPIAPLVTDHKSLDYSHRIIIPIEWEGRVVSFQGRDVTNRHKLKYMACPQVRELIEHKSILYGRAPGKRAALVEGVTDVWKLGVGSLACFGVKYRLPQIKILAKYYDEVVTLFDPDEAGNTQAKKIIAELAFRGVKVIQGDCGKTDPGEMSYADAAYLMKTYGL